MLTVGAAVVAKVTFVLLLKARVSEDFGRDELPTGEVSDIEEDAFLEVADEVLLLLPLGRPAWLERP